MLNGKNSENLADFCPPHTQEKSFISSSSSNITHKNESPSWGSARTPLKLRGHTNTNSPPPLLSSGQSSAGYSQSKISLLGDDESDEQIRFSQVGRKKDFTHIERVEGKQVNVLKGLELHTKVFSAAEQKKIVDFVYSLQKKGQEGELRGIQFNCEKKTF